jgi:hypothetical protein
LQSITNAIGTRRSCGSVGVDAGLMVIAADHAFPGEAAIDDLDFHDYPTMKQRQRYAISSSGIGDGGYDVLVVERAGTIVGVEVLFICNAAEQLTERYRDEAGLVQPEGEMWRSTEQADRDVCNAYWQAMNKLFAQAWAEVALTTPPEGTPHVLGALTVHEGVSIGDPCYGDASQYVPVPFGVYEAIAWTDEMDQWGERVYRLGVYRVEP